jgi:hypothetical protein
MMAMSAVPAYLLGQWFDRKSARQPGEASMMEVLT